jgi:hypothetical protein
MRSENSEIGDLQKHKMMILKAKIAAAIVTQSTSLAVDCLVVEGSILHAGCAHQKLIWEVWQVALP